MKEVFNERRNQELPEHYTVPHKITLLTVMAIGLLPISLAGFLLAIMLMMYGQLHINDIGEQGTLTQIVSGFSLAIFIVLYIAAHWLVVYRFYQNIEATVFGKANAARLYLLLGLNVVVLISSLYFGFYSLPLFVLPLALIAINVYLIYLRKKIIHGHF